MLSALRLLCIEALISCERQKLGFQVDNRYLAVTALDSRAGGGYQAPNSQTESLLGNTATVDSACNTGINHDGPMMILVY
jgi:hypothetical protein